MARLRLVAASAALASTALLSACSARGSGAPHAASGHVRVVAGERMPAAPDSRAAWLSAVENIYDHAAGGRSAEQWLRRRMATRRPGERLAVVMGIDDVMLETHFGGAQTLVARSVRFAQTAHALGYSVFYVTGRSASSGLGDVEATLQRAGVPANAIYGRPVGAPDVEAAKAECRAAIKKQGYTLAMAVAASEASFDGRPRAEKEVRLPDFGVPG